MKFWSYKVVVGSADAKFEAELTALGKDTWECCGVAPQPGGKIVCVFKRELSVAPKTGSVKVATRDATPYIPGIPTGTEAD